MIQPECLRDTDPEELAQIAEAQKELKFLKCYRDWLKIHDGNAVLVIKKCGACIKTGPRIEIMLS